jgi:hypothetical protein
MRCIVLIEMLEGGMGVGGTDLERSMGLAVMIYTKISAGASGERGRM